MASILSVMSAPAARAQDPCADSTVTTIELDDGAASATINVRKGCSDGLSRFDGVVRDISCDGREAKLWLRFFNPDAGINSNGNPYAWDYRGEEPTAGNGCGTESTFSYSSTNPYPNMYAVAYADGLSSFESDGDEAWF
jgi:hypothetical protein